MDNNSENQDEDVELTALREIQMLKILSNLNLNREDHVISLVSVYKTFD